MELKDLVEEAVKLTPTERARVIETLLHSLDRPDPDIDQAWGEKAAARLLAVRDGRLVTVPAGQVLD